MTAVHEPETIEEAVGLLASLGEEAAPLAGGTWVMRAPLRDERLRPHYVALRRIAGLRNVERANGDVRLGAGATHAEIGAVDGALEAPGRSAEEASGVVAALAAMAEAARRSAFPAVRNVATLGGNLASPFPEADLVPPLLAGEATLEVAHPGGRQTVDVATWLSAPRRPDALIVAARVPAPPGRRSWFERLTVRAGAEYSVASAAVSVDLDADGRAVAARVAVGAVQDAATRVPAAEAVLTGARLDRATGEEAGRAAAEALDERDGLDAPGWYRLAVLPALIGRAVERLAAASPGDPPAEGPLPSGN